MNTKTQDVLLASLPGSVGQFVLHLLLLTRQLQSVFGYHGFSFDEFRELQFASPKKTWGKPLSFLDNAATAKLENCRKLFWYHKDTDLSQFQHTCKITIFSDIKTHNFLLKSKDIQGDSIYAHFKNEYLKVKGSDWPDCNDFLQFSKLPEWIQQEARQMSDYFNTNYHNDNVGCPLWQGNPVNENFMPLLRNSNFTFQLRDIIHTKGHVLFDRLNLEPTNETDSFVDFYISLHTEEQKHYLLS